MAIVPTVDVAIVGECGFLLQKASQQLLELVGVRLRDGGREGGMEGARERGWVGGREGGKDAGGEFRVTRTDGKMIHRATAWQQCRVAEVTQ